MVEHSFDYVKTRLQADGGKSSFQEIVSSIYSKYGVKGFYSGAMPNIARVAIKQSYRMPMMIWLSPFYQSFLFESNNNSVIAAKGLSSLTIASFECFIVTPLEKFKIMLMTNKEKNFRDLLLGAHQPIRASMRDINIVFPRQIVAWSTFMVPEEFLKNLVRNNDKDLSFKTLFAISFAVCIINTTATMPLDAIKTLVQKDKPWSNQGLIKTMASAYNVYGLKGIYAGWQLRATQYMLQAYFTTSLIETLERNIRKKNKPG